MTQSTVLVAIHCLVYNHEPYLRDCLEGFVMQQTSFPFVAIVHDDASTDGSTAIIREYEEKYPDIIKPIYETENQWRKPDGSLGRIMNAAIDATGAKYVAMCEGDDYWTDPLKLQKQVDFLESHPDYVMCWQQCKFYLQTENRFTI
jgi:glycosyltransferase involved in cell wall biosynthesis